MIKEHKELTLVSDSLAYFKCISLSFLPFKQVSKDMQHAT